MLVVLVKTRVGEGGSSSLLKWDETGVRRPDVSQRTIPEAPDVSHFALFTQALNPKPPTLLQYGSFPFSFPLCQYKPNIVYVTLYYPNIYALYTQESQF